MAICLVKIHVIKGEENNPQESVRSLPSHLKKPSRQPCCTTSFVLEEISNSPRVLEQEAAQIDFRPRPYRLIPLLWVKRTY